MKSENIKKNTWTFHIKNKRTGKRKRETNVKRKEWEKTTTTALLNPKLKYLIHFRPVCIARFYLALSLNGLHSSYLLTFSSSVVTLCACAPIHYLANSTLSLSRCLLYSCAFSNCFHCLFLLLVWFVSLTHSINMAELFVVGTFSKSQASLVRIVQACFYLL